MSGYIFLPYISGVSKFQRKQHSNDNNKERTAVRGAPPGPGHDKDNEGDKDSPRGRPLRTWSCGPDSLLTRGPATHLTPLSLSSPPTGGQHQTDRKHWVGLQLSAGLWTIANGTCGAKPASGMMAPGLPVGVSQRGPEPEGPRRAEQ